MYRNCIRVDPLMAILVVAAVMRVIFVVLAPAEPRGDAYIYHQAAIGIANGDGYTRLGHPFAIFPVGWPAALATIYWVTDQSLWAPRLFNVGCGVLAVYATYQIGRKCFASTPVGLLAAGLLALYPNHIAYSSLLFTESFYTALLLGGVALMVHHDGKRTTSAAIGVVFGVAVLTKPQTVLVPLVVWLFVRDEHAWAARLSITRTWQMAWTYALMALVLAPWLYRNYTVFNDFVFVSTNGGFNLYIGNNPQAEGFYKTTPEIWQAIGDEDEPGPQAELRRDRTARQLALEWMVAHPIDVARLAVLKAVGTWRDTTEGIGWASNGARVNVFPLRTITRVIYPIIWLLAVAAPILTRRYHLRAASSMRLAVLPAALIAYFTSMSMLFFADERFAFPVLPMVLLYAAYSVVIWRNYRGTPR